MVDRQCLFILAVAIQVTACGGGGDDHVFDADGDGYVLLPACQGAGAPVYTGPLPQTDCDDTRANVNPGVTVDTPYDGIDSNCDGVNDFDQDGDGYISDVYVAAYDVFAQLCGQTDGRTVGDDCSDDPAGVTVGSVTIVGAEINVAADDTWYDGIDQDCAGDHDYDQDGDGSLCDPVFTVACGVTPNPNGSDPAGDDCNDDPAGETVGTVTVLGADINPNATETWYDAIDQDCAGDHDYDRDGDGFLCDPAVIAACAVNPNPNGGDPAGDDCIDDESTVYPGALELVGDGLDHDCDGGDDTSPFAFGSSVWDLPGPPIVDHTRDDYLISWVADSYTSGSTEVEAGQLDYWDLTDALPNTDPTAGLPFDRISATGAPLGGQAMQARADGEDGWYVGESYNYNGAAFMTLHRIELVSGTEGYEEPTSAFETAQADATALYNDHDLYQDVGNDQTWFAACGANRLHFMTVTPGTATALDLVDKAWGDGAGGHACYLEPVNASSAILHLYDGTHTEYTLDLGTAGANDDAIISQSCTTSCDASDSYCVADVNRRGVLTVFAGGADCTDGNPFDVTVWQGGSVLHTLDTVSPTLSADAWLHDGTLYIVAVIEDSNSDMLNELVFAYGDPAVPLTEVSLPFDHPTLAPNPEGVSVYVDDDRVLVAVSAPDAGGTDDAVGWLFMGHGAP